MGRATPKVAVVVVVAAAAPVLRMMMRKTMVVAVGMSPWLECEYPLDI